MAGSAPGSTASSGRSGGRARRIGTLLLGFLLGALMTAVVVVALLWSGIVDSESVGAPVGTSPTPTAESAPAAAPASSGDVPSSCVRSAEFNQTFTEALDEMALGIRDQDARRLQEALDAVQDAQPGSQDASAECLELANQGSDDAQTSEDTEASEDSESTEDSSESPEPSPTATP